MYEEERIKLIVPEGGYKDYGDEEPTGIVCNELLETDSEGNAIGDKLKARLSTLNLLALSGRCITGVTDKPGRSMVNNKNYSKIEASVVACADILSRPEPVPLVARSKIERRHARWQDNMYYFLGCDTPIKFHLTICRGQNLETTCHISNWPYPAYSESGIEITIPPKQFDNLSRAIENDLLDYVSLRLHTRVYGVNSPLLLAERDQQIFTEEGKEIKTDHRFGGNTSDFDLSWQLRDQVFNHDLKKLLDQDIDPPPPGKHFVDDDVSDEQSIIAVLSEQIREQALKNRNRDKASLNRNDKIELILYVIAVGIFLNLIL